MKGIGRLRGPHSCHHDRVPHLRRGFIATKAGHFAAAKIPSTVNFAGALRPQVISARAPSPPSTVDTMQRVRYQLHVIGSLARRVYYHDKPRQMTHLQQVAILTPLTVVLAQFFVPSSSTLWPWAQQ